MFNNVSGCILLNTFMCFQYNLIIPQSSKGFQLKEQDTNKTQWASLRTDLSAYICKPSPPTSLPVLHLYKT